MFETEKYKHKYRIPSTRLQSWDYSSHGLYFVTICTKNRELYFAGPPNILPSNTGNTQNIGLQSPLVHTVIGNIANQYWVDIPKHFPFVELDEYIIMPNHVHGILFLNKPEYRDWQLNKFGPQSKNLGSIIRGYKAGVKTFATINKIDFGWQPRFHDRIIRSEKELNNIRQYIISNPEKWHQDKNNPENLLM